MSKICNARNFLSVCTSTLLVHVKVQQLKTLLDSMVNGGCHSGTPSWPRVSQPSSVIL